MVDALQREPGVGRPQVATVVGDDVRPRADASSASPTTRCSPTPTSAPGPSSTRSTGGAHIVITGRVADASLFLAPLVHEYGWAWDDWDRLAAGVVVGHLLECSGQVAGGNYSGRWWENPDPLRIAVPDRRGRARRLRRHHQAASAPAAIVTFDTVREQLLYEVHDPARYLNPDVDRRLHVAHASSDLGDDRVRVSGHAGRAAAGDVQGPRVHARRLGGRGAVSRTRGPTPRPRPAPPSRFVRARAEAARRRRSRSGARSTSASTPSAARPSPTPRRSGIRPR